MPTADTSREEPGLSSGKWRLVLDRERHAPARARAEISDLGLAPSRDDDLALLVSEVVTNAIRHGGVDAPGQVVVEVEATEERILVRVLDGGDRVPVPRTPGADGGFGLHLVESLARRWGSGPGEIWFEMAVRA